MLTSNSEQIEAIVNSMEKDVQDIKQEALKMTWYMRGGLSFTEAMHLGSQERKLINNIIKDNLDTTKKTKLPFF